MTDRLKLSDPKDNTLPDQVARVLEVDDAVRRIKELERNNAALARLLAAKKAPIAPAPTHNNKIGARKDGIFKAISTAPSINWTPRGSAMVPVAYPTVQDLSSSTGVARTVRFNGHPVYLFDSSAQPACKGDDQGTGGGIRSGTVNGEVKPVEGSKSVKVEGKRVVREGDACTMNGGNNPGAYVTTQAPSAASATNAIASSNPPITLDTPNEKAAFRRWLAETEEQLLQALKHPVDAAKGAIKGSFNAFPGMADLIIKAAAEQRASELDDSATTARIFGNEKDAYTQHEIAKNTRDLANNVDIPKFKIVKPAEEGGDKLSTIVQVFAGGVGALKGSTKLIGKIDKATAAVNGGATTVSNVDKVAHVITSAASPVVGGGVKILPRRGAGKYTIRGEIKYRSASEVNATFPAGWEPPYKPGTRVVEFATLEDDVYVRVHGELNMARSWMMKKEAVAGLTAREIQSKYGLPALPIYITEVHVPAGTHVRTGIVNPVFGGVGNATQYELLDRLPLSSFKNTTRIAK